MIDNPVVLMAGGLGTRLWPYTKDCPKPLVKVGGTPILEIIINNFIKNGFTRFFIAVNYRSNQIKEYFKDASDLGVKISYLNEEKPLGTAGALRLLPEIPKKPIIVMNGDILTKIDFNELLSFHQTRQAAATIGAHKYNLNVPYGVVSITRDSEFLNISEKPVFSYLINGGIYVIEPFVIKLIPETYYEMTDLFKKIHSNQMKVSVYLFSDYWLDIGEKEDLEKANQDYFKYF